MYIANVYRCIHNTQRYFSLYGILLSGIMLYIYMLLFIMYIVYFLLCYSLYTIILYKKNFDALEAKTLPFFLNLFLAMNYIVYF